MRNKMTTAANLKITAFLGVVALGLGFQTILLGQIAISLIAIVNIADLASAHMKVTQILPQFPAWMTTRPAELASLGVALGISLFCVLSTVHA